MENFTFANTTKIIFGRGTEAGAGAEMKPLAQRVLLHYGKDSIRKSGLHGRVLQSLKAAGISCVELGGVVPNPRVSLVREGIRLCREHKLGGILAVGGGSVIDSAKAIAAGVPYEGDVWDFYLKRATIESALPIGVVLTIPAAGSESSFGSVITNEEGSYKRDALSEHMRPKFAILDPELTFSLPPYQTAAGAADIMAHVFERYFTSAKAVDFTDRLCEATLQTIIEHAPRALAKPGDYDSRAEIMWAGTVAHNDLLSTGRIGDWGSHMIEHEISAIYDVAHGAGLAVVFPAWMKRVYEHDVARFAQFAFRVFGVEHSFAHPERTAREGIRRLEEFFRRIGMPVTLRELGVPVDRLAEMARKCTERGPVGNFVKMGEREVLEVLELAR
ncbi:MAG: butanol dehydrogenase [Spirochaetes bacterium RBG_13_68_11]|nr:MAG: butanol dehydrogenase [Spirochaetes bacterium RBG_13_68_11]